MLLSLKQIGFLVGLEFIAIALVLSYRERYYDGISYPAKVPFAFFFAGVTVVLTLSEVTLAAVLDSFSATLLLYYLLAGLGGLAFAYFWYIWPTDRNVVVTLRRLRDRLR